MSTKERFLGTGYHSKYMEELALTGKPSEKTGLSILPGKIDPMLDVYYENLRADEEITFWLYITLLAGIAMLVVGVLA